MRLRLRPGGVSVKGELWFEFHHVSILGGEGAA